MVGTNVTSDIAALQAQVELLRGELSLLEANVLLQGSANTFWLIFAGSLVFFMQCGFGMLEAGNVRLKNTKNILLKNLLDACIGALIWWMWGHATAVRRAPLAPRRALDQRVPLCRRLRPRRTMREVAERPQRRHAHLEMKTSDAVDMGTRHGCPPGTKAGILALRAPSLRFWPVFTLRHARLPVAPRAWVVADEA